uniref:Peptidyl-prolyl cis-trans isomerase n=1 Tax=Ananas comosus var. bracteatus TaxID=296719 RepID=A0A6V7PFF3_ANACO|nr:unnamed protein product [Ananas comosus var. bracteatus]
MSAKHEAKNSNKRTGKDKIGSSILWHLYLGFCCTFLRTFAIKTLESSLRLSFGAQHALTKPPKTLALVSPMASAAGTNNSGGGGGGGGGAANAAATAAAVPAPPLPPPPPAVAVEWHQRPPNPKNPIVFFDVTIGTIPAGRIKMELFADFAPRPPRTSGIGSLLSPSSCSGGVPIGYKGCQFHRVIKDFMIQAGDFLKGDGSGCVSIYGSKFEDENFIAKHTGPGLLSMANSGPNSNGCQFFVTCAKCEWLDNKHVVFGVLGEGLLVVRKIENVATGPNNRPKLACVIAECGEM